ncbi:hypothetical protein HNS38_12225 [Lentimicrobium sp. L6]|nr:hypothetical protein [Lentimicrobium sp. L6]
MIGEATVMASNITDRGSFTSKSKMFGSLGSEIELEISVNHVKHNSI